MNQIYIEYQKRGIFNAFALMFLMDLSGIKYEKEDKSDEQTNYDYPYGIKMTWDGKEFYSPAASAKLIAKKTGLDSKDTSIMEAEVKLILRYLNINMYVNPITQYRFCSWIFNSPRVSSFRRSTRL